MSKKRQSRRGARDSSTGRFIPIKEAERRPGRTQKENIPLPGYGDTGRGKKESRGERFVFDPFPAPIRKGLKPPKRGS